MRYEAHLLFLFAVFSLNVQASMFGEENALLFELVTTTAGQLNELEKLLANAEKYTEKMQKYNELAQDEYFKAERISYLAESLAAKHQIENLGEFNSALKDLKNSMLDLKVLLNDYSQIKGEERVTQNSSKIKKGLNKHKYRLAESQVRKSINARNTGRATQLTAQNTSLLLESNVDINNSQIDLVEKVSTTNRLLAEQLEISRKQEVLKRKSYFKRETSI